MQSRVREETNEGRRISASQETEANVRVSKLEEKDGHGGLSVALRIAPRRLLQSIVRSSQTASSSSGRQLPSSDHTSLPLFPAHGLSNHDATTQRQTAIFVLNGHGEHSKVLE